MRIRACLIMFIGLAPLPGCAVTASRVAAYRPTEVSDDGTEWRRAAFESRHDGRLDDDRIGAVRQVVATLTGGDWRGPAISVGILATDEPNAFVLANGHVYVTHGMLEIICDDDELAAVVAHELAHLDDLSAFDGSGLGGDEKLRIESEADERAIDLLINTPFDPTALGRMIRRLADVQPAGWADYRCGRLDDVLGLPADAHDCGAN